MKYDRHGSVNTPTYNSWRSMKARCNNPKAVHYEYYGGLGIKVCERWQGVLGFRNFRDDLGERPKNTTLDRIDVLGNYTPENCRWADTIRQRINQKKRVSGSSIYRGVSITKRRSGPPKWAANVCYKGKITYLGCFDTEKEAALAYNAGALIHHGEYANLNTID